MVVQDIWCIKIFHFRNLLIYFPIRVHCDPIEQDDRPFDPNTTCTGLKRDYCIPFLPLCFYWIKDPYPWPSWFSKER
eukprot:g67298.t1